jgi:hypothetical protein
MASPPRLPTPIAGPPAAGAERDDDDRGARPTHPTPAWLDTLVNE